MKRLKNLSTLIVLFLVIAGLAAPLYAAGGKININTAPKEQLMTLKYVGSATADKIIAYRQNQPFKVPEDIMKVKGVGQKTFDANKDMICCSD